MTEQTRTARKFSSASYTDLIYLSKEIRALSFPQQRRVAVEAIDRGLLKLPLIYRMIEFVGRKRTRTDKREFWTTVVLTEHGVRVVDDTIDSLCRHLVYGSDTFEHDISVGGDIVRMKSTILSRSLSLRNVRQ